MFLPLSFVIRIFSILLVVITAYSCNNDVLESKEKNEIRTQENLIKINRLLVSRESARIDSCVKQNHWEMTKTGTGLRYMIIQKGEGGRIENNQSVSLHYKIKDLKGNVLEKTEDNQAERFETGKAQMPKGLEEAVMLMNKGSVARIILPSHLAFGLDGRGAIEPGSSIIYEFEILK